MEENKLYSKIEFDRGMKKLKLYHGILDWNNYT